MQNRPERPCPNCGSSSNKPIPRYQDILLQCTNCGLVHSRHEPTNTELEAYYKNYPVRDVLSPVTALRYDELLEKFAPYRSFGRIMDVGCGAGLFLQRALAKGWEVHGTEYGKRAVKACLERGIPLIEGPLDPANYTAGSFDVVCSFEVIEHLTHPAEEVARMMTLLRPGGLLYVTTPNFNCLDRKISKGEWNVVNYPEHLNYFTPITLDKLLRDKGLQKEWLITTGMSVSRLKMGRTNDPVRRTEAKRSEEDLRQAMESKFHLKIAKRLMNAALDMLKLGDSMKAAYRKPLQW